MKKVPRKRKPVGQTFASDLPKIRDWMADEVVDMAAMIEGDPDGYEGFYAQHYGVHDPSGFAATASAQWRALEARLRAEDCALWWVSQSMAKLAFEAAQSIPTWTPAAARPSRHGVVMWDMGSGVTYDRPPLGSASAHRSSCLCSGVCGRRPIAGRSTSRRSRPAAKARAARDSTLPDQWR